ncbi:hypothetical protein BDW22DRAFT_1227501 [Trametopsis cervina]|nr:hypothetical protein BDW22DRAFT_1227501 [Trametopsis cervina]
MQYLATQISPFSVSTKSAVLYDTHNGASLRPSSLTLITLRQRTQTNHLTIRRQMHLPCARRPHYVPAPIYLGRVTEEARIIGTDYISGVRYTSDPLVLTHLCIRRPHVLLSLEMQPPSLKNMSKPLEAVQPPMLWNALPFEILSMIFNYLAPPSPVQVYKPDNNKALYTESEVAFERCFPPLALVCRHWYAAVHPYLNRFLSVRFRPDLPAETGIDADIVGPWHLSIVLRWLDSRPYLLASVRRLRLIMDNEACRCGCDPSLVYALLHRFPNVRAVELFDVGFDRPQLAAYASTITTTHIAPIDLDTLLLTYGGYWPILSDAVQMCTAWFGSVSALIVRRNSFPSEPFGTAIENLPVRLAARTLTIDLPILEGVMMYLRRLSSFGDQGTLRILHVKIPLSAIISLISLNLVLPLTANVLEELHLDFNFTVYQPFNLFNFFAYSEAISDYDKRSLWPHVDLGVLPRLRELTIQLSLLNGGRTAVHRIINTLLPRAQPDEDGRGPPPLRYVTLAPREYEMMDPAHKLWFARVSAVLAGVLTLERCTLDLREVRNVSDGLEHSKAWFKEHMAELHGKGILHFVT